MTAAGEEGLTPSQWLADTVEEVLPAWVERSVATIAVAWFGSVPPELASAAREAGLAARREVGARLRALLALDIDAQPTGPLAVLRTAVAHPTAVLEGAGVPAVERDEFAERAFPADRYGLSPATWADVDPSLHEPGLIWGAWKAQQHLARRRRPPEGTA